MANNRLLLKCERCGDEIGIARLQVGMDHVWLPARVSVVEYEAWLAKHSDCFVDSYDAGLHVSLVSECLDSLTLGPTAKS